MSFALALSPVPTSRAAVVPGPEPSTAPAIGQSSIASEPGSESAPGEKVDLGSPPCGWQSGFYISDLDNPVWALAVFDEGTGPAVYAGGGFAAAGGVLVNGIAKWNGDTWTELSGPSGIGVSGQVQALEVFDDGSGPALYAGGYFEIAGGLQVNGIAKWNGSEWSALEGPSGVGVNGAVRALAVFDDGNGSALYAGGAFTTAGGVAVNRIAKWDGNSWVPVGTGFDGAVNSLTVVDLGSGASLYAGGEFTRAGGVGVNRVARWNGFSWVRLQGALGTGVDGQVLALTGFDDGSGPALYAGGLFLSAGGSHVSRIAKWNGSDWSALIGQSGAGVNDAVRSLTTFDDGSGPALYAGGSFTTASGLLVNGIAKWNGSVWAALPGPTGVGVDGMVTDLAVFDASGGPTLFVGGGFRKVAGVEMNRIARWSGTEWSALGVSSGNGMNSGVFALSEGISSTIFAGGSFTTAGGLAARGIAEWVGTGWSTLGGADGSGLDGSVYSLIVFDDGSGPALYAGGSFDRAGGEIVNGIARWNGNTWSALPGPAEIGVNGTIRAMAVFDDGGGPALYVGGDFSRAGGLSVGRIAKWDGGSWSALTGPAGNGVGSSVHALSVFDEGNGPALYAGGSFITAGGVPARFVAKWNGLAWSGLSEPAGLSNSVYSLAVFDDGSRPALYAGGFFTLAGQATVNYVAKWDGIGWTALEGPSGAGTGGEVKALTVFDDGRGPALYVGGSFESAGGVPADWIARWDGSEWSAFSEASEEGLNFTVSALAATEEGGAPVLYVGGAFTTAGGLPSSQIAKYVACPDLTPPSGPAVQATVPAEGTWSSVTTIEVTFAGASDEPGGSGLAGYSVAFDQSATAVPDETVEIPHVADPHVATSSPLPDGDGWFFHLSTCDLARNCSSAIHAGPFRIDTKPPSAPASVTSPSHDGGPSNDPMIDIEWTAATDSLSGVAGYSYDFAETPTPPSCASLSSTTPSTSASSTALADGTWYAHVCAVDNAGNFGDVTSGGPYEIDTTAAAVESVGSVPDSGDGVLVDGEVVLGGTTRLLVRWSDAMADPAGDSDPEDVTNPANYRLVGAGSDGAIGTGVCAPVAGDDVEWPFTAAAYDSTNEASALRLAGPLAIPADLYRISICGTIEDDAGNPTTAASIDFRVLGSDLLAQPNFDDDLAGWTVDDPFPGSLLWSPDDAGGEGSSGSAEVVTADGVGGVWSLSQCVPVEAPRWLGRFRARIASSTPDQPEVTLRAEWFADSDCEGAGLGSASAPAVTGDTSDAWLETFHDGGVPPGAASARIAAIITGGIASSFTVAVDDLFHGDPFTLFFDGFETATTERWSATVPLAP